VGTPACRLSARLEHIGLCLEQCRDLGRLGAATCAADRDNRVSVFVVALANLTDPQRT
jgi:hypothetical protein